MRKIFSKNPLSYLGWLGIIGVIGINTGNFIQQIFLVFFFFFIYRNTTPDELFWLNVRKAGTGAFLIFLVFNSLIFFLISVFEENSVAVTTEERIFVIRGFGIVYLGSILYFLFMLLYYKKQEIGNLEEEEC